MEDFKKRLHPLLAEAPSSGPIRVAILDTGALFADEVLDLYDGQLIECRNWHDCTDENGEHMPDGGDDDGHGTHVASLLLGVAPNCHVYVARVSGHRKAQRSASANHRVGWQVAQVCVYISKHRRDLHVYVGDALCS